MEQLGARCKQGSHPNHSPWFHQSTLYAEPLPRTRPLFGFRLNQACPYPAKAQSSGAGYRETPHDHRTQGVLSSTDGRFGEEGSPSLEETSQTVQDTLMWGYFQAATSNKSCQNGKPMFLTSGKYIEYFPLFCP